MEDLLSSIEAFKTYQSTSSHYGFDDEAVKLFASILRHVSSLEDLKLLDEKTKCTDTSEITDEDYSVSIWNIECDGAVKLCDLVQVYILDMSQKLLDDLNNIADAEYLLKNITHMSGNLRALEARKSLFISQINAKFPPSEVPEPSSAPIMKPAQEVFVIIKPNPERRLFHIDSKLLRYETEFPNNDHQRKLFIGATEDFDSFFQSKGKDTEAIKLLKRYKKLLRIFIKDMSLAELEEVYHQTTCNGVSSKVILEKFAAEVKKVSPDCSADAKNKLADLRKANQLPVEEKRIKRDLKKLGL